MALAPGIVQTARSLGINPVDLATVISYETAGTFDPTKRGPTTQWGQHRGLIQFGEPQAVVASLVMMIAGAVNVLAAPWVRTLLF